MLAFFICPLEGSTLLYNEHQADAIAIMGSSFGLASNNYLSPACNEVCQHEMNFSLFADLHFTAQDSH